MALCDSVTLIQYGDANAKVRVVFNGPDGGVSKQYSTIFDAITAATEELKQGNVQHIHIVRASDVELSAIDGGYVLSVKGGR